MTFLFNFLGLLCEVLTMAIFIRVIMSWFSPGPTNMLANIVYQVTEPILAPLRRIIPKVGPLDFTPLVAVILLQLIIFILARL